MLLELLGFTVKIVKRFGTPQKPMPLCLIIIAKNQNSAAIYELNELFYLKIKIEAYRKSRLSQCYACQRFGHCSQNCGHAPRCVKCSGEHNARDCAKTLDQEPMCCNCGGPHTTNFRGCPYYIFTRSRTDPARKPAPNPITIAPLTENPTTKDTPNPIKKANPLSYADAVNPSSKQAPSNSIDIRQVLKLLQDLLIALSSPDNDPKETMSKIINAFITLISPHNE